MIDAFYAGYETISPGDFDYLCKLDLDLRLPERYFEILIERMEKNPRMGTSSGKSYVEEGGRLVSERKGDETSLGMTKFYRVACFEETGGFVREVMWDGIDCHRCRMLGRMRHGFGQYFMGTGFLYMFASAVFHMNDKPYVFGAAAMMWGWLSSAIKGLPRYEDLAFRRFLRRYQRRSLVVGKARAVDELHRERYRNRLIHGYACGSIHLNPSEWTQDRVCVGDSPLAHVNF